MPPYALFDGAGLADAPGLFWAAPVDGAGRFAGWAPPGEMPVPVPVEGLVPTAPVEGVPAGPVEGRVPTAPVDGLDPTAPVEGAAPTFPVEGRVPTAPVEGRAPTFPVAGRVPTFPVEGREFIAPVEGWAPPGLQPRASRVLAEPVDALVVRIRFWSGCHRCVLFTLTFLELLTLTLTFRLMFTLTFPR